MIIKVRLFVLVTNFISKNNNDNENRPITTKNNEKKSQTIKLQVFISLYSSS